MNKYKGRVVRKEMLKPNIGILEFELDDELNFVPGQFCNIKVEAGGEPKLRPYSMAYPPREDNVEFYVKSYPDGSVAQYILDLEEGEEAEITGPFGSFKLQDTDNPIYMICAGSGVAPMICMARHLREQDSEREVEFLHGASYVDELSYMEELKEMSEGDNFTYLPTVSRPEENPGWDGNKGRVEEYLNRCTDKEAEVYVCGPPPMVSKVIKELTEKGFSQESIFTERYY